MTESLTDEQKQQIIEEYLKKEAASTEQKAKEAAEQAERDAKGRFKPKPSSTPPPEPPPDPAKGGDEPTSDQLLDTIEKDFKESLKGHAILNELEGLDQRTRIRMLRAVSNAETTKPKGEGQDPSHQAPPVENAPKTLAELNNMTDYLHDVQKRTSMFNITDQIRGRK